MDTSPVVNSETIIEPIAPPARANAKPPASPEPKLDKFAAARYAKKLQRRKAHRAVIRRSNTNG